MAHILAIAALLLGLVSGQVAAQQPETGSACNPATESCWVRPGIAPYGHDSRLVPAALDKLLTPDIVPVAADREAIRRFVLIGTPSWRENIPSNFRATRMLFRGGQTLPNVVADTARWGNATRMASFYRIALSDGSIALVGQPDICGNWFIVIITPQGVCIRDEVLCGPECERLRRQISGNPR
ncbi:hypothetical protein K2X96_03255 [Patescibacteria group bacterium]|nr:hypothetical protein [Patescibacteria group bacterium]